MTVGTLALVITAAILLQVAVAAVFGLRRRRRSFLEEGRRPAAQPASPAVESTAPGGAWEGFREFVVQRRVVENANGDICSFYLVPKDGRPLPPFRPGQYLTFRLQVEDPQTGERRNVVRCYSLSDRPRPDYYRVTIKRVPAPPGHPEYPPGVSSNHFHDHVREGSSLMVKAPAGHFHLLEDEPLPIVLLAGGIGITPMLSMVNHLLEKGSRREIRLFYGVRNGAEEAMRDHLAGLARAHGNFHLLVCYSDPEGEEASADEFRRRGRIDIPLLRSRLQLKRYQSYVCGPKPMMESLVPGLEEWGVDSDDIHYESFGPASLEKRGQAKRTAGDAAPPVAVAFTRSGGSAPWNPAFGSLLEFLEDRGLEVESGCRAGSCGSCQTRLEAGEVEYSQQPDADIEPGHCLLCVSTPKSDISLAV